MNKSFFQKTKILGIFGTQLIELIQFSMIELNLHRLVQLQKSNRIIISKYGDIVY